MAQESGGDPNATGAAGEVGLMQISPGWGPSSDPWTNISQGVAILKQCNDANGGWHYGDTWEDALYCYNTGRLGGWNRYVGSVRAIWTALAAQGA
jgi:soluble lytic murein transglycosylase-like protein